MWSPIDAARKNREQNEAKRDRAIKQVQEHWGEQGKKFLELRQRIQWAYKVGRFAKEVPDYDQAMVLVNRAIYTRRLKVRRGVSSKLLPGGTDIIDALNLSKLRNQSFRLTEEELLLLPPDEPMWIGGNGLLEYGRTQPPSTFTKLENSESAFQLEINSESAFLGQRSFN